MVDFCAVSFQVSGVEGGLGVWGRQSQQDMSRYAIPNDFSGRVVSCSLLFLICCKTKGVLISEVRVWRLTGNVSVELVLFR